MKSFQIFVGLFAGFLTLFSSCTSLFECENMEHRQVTFLLDVSDKKLFSEIENDMTTNMPGFMQRTQLGTISTCQGFTLSFAHLSGKDALDISSASIAIKRKGQSLQDEQRQASHEPLGKFMRKKLGEYRALTEDPQITSGSNIANVLLKTINQSDPMSDNYFVVFSDFVENNRQLNLYKGIPGAADAPELVEKMIESHVLETFRRLQTEGLQPKVIVVMKPEPAGKTNIREVKELWVSVFKELELEVQFIDNLSNKVSL